MSLEKGVRFLGLAIFLVALLAGKVFADQCPYCGDVYGEPMPGDEERVYQLRAAHEATCSKRPRPISPGDNTGAVDSGLIQQQQQLWQQQERRRKEQEAKRKARQEEEAKKRAEAERRKFAWEEKKKELMSSLKGASSSDMSLKTDVEGGPLEPHKGTDLFGTFSEKKDTGLVLKGTSSAPQTPASTSVLENIRRYRWLWQKAGEAYKAGNEEEYRFLMEEAAHALAGEPLRVAVPASALPILDEGQQEEFLELRTRIQGKKVELEGLGARHMSCEDTHVVLKNQLAAAEKEVQSLNRELGIAEKEGFMDKVVKLQEDIASKMRNEKPPEKKDPVREALEKERQEKEKKRQDCLARILKVKEELRKADAELNKIENEEKQAQKGLKEEEQKFQDFMKKLP